MHHGGYILLAMWNVVSSNLEDTTGRRIYLAKRDSSGSSPGKLYMVYIVLTRDSPSLISAGTWSLSLFRKMPLASFKHFPTITTSVSSVCTWRQSMHLGFGSSHCRSNPHSRVRIQAVGDTCPGRVAFFVSALPPQEDFVISIIDWWRRMYHSKRER